MCMTSFPVMSRDHVIICSVPMLFYDEDCKMLYVAAKVCPTVCIVYIRLCYRISGNLDVFKLWQS